MRTLLALLAVAALTLVAACGSEEATDKAPAAAPSTTKPDAGPAMDAAKDAADAAKDKAASAEITYKCGCGKEKTLAADQPAPS